MALPRSPFILTSVPKPEHTVVLQQDPSKQFLIDPIGNVWDWRDPKGNWTNRALLEGAYALFILTRCDHYWRPSFTKFNELIYQDFLRKKSRASEYRVFLEGMKVNLVKALNTLQEILAARADPIYPLFLRLKDKKETSLDLLDAVLKELLLSEHFKVSTVMQFYCEFTVTSYGWENVKELIPLPTSKKIITDDKIAALYQKALPKEIYSPEAKPEVRGRFARNRKEITDDMGRVGYIAYDGYTLVEAPYRKYAHFSATNFFAVMKESDSNYVREMHERGFNVNAGPSGTMGRMQFLIQCFMHDNLITELEAKRMTIAMAANFVNRGHHTFIEALQACQKKPLKDSKSCFGLFTTPPHLLISDPRLVYENFFLKDLLANIDSKMYQSFRENCADLVRPIPKSRFSGKLGAT